MGLQIQEPIHHVNAGFLHPFRPRDVASFVEPRLELDQHRDLLSLFGGLDQPLDHR